MNLLYNFKTCPRCAASNLTVDNQKILTCRSCGFTYFHNTAAAVAAIVEHDSEILIVKRAKEPLANMLDLPGGFVDYNESAEDALKREVREELDLEIENLRFLTSAPNTYFYKNIQYYVLDLFFTCRPVNLEDIKPNNEVADYRFIKAQNVPLTEIAFESTKKALGFYIKNLPS
jgi:mutator protein MutT